MSATYARKRHLMRESMRHYAACHLGLTTDGAYLACAHLLLQYSRHSLIDVDTCRHLTHLAADRTCRLIAFEEDHLTVPSFLEAMFEAVQGCCVDVFL